MSDTDLQSSAETEEFQLTLNTIPVEVFLHICTFLDGKELIKTLKIVCRSFYEILSDDEVWRSWLKNRWPELPTSNVCYKDDDIPGHTVCLQVDRGLKLWSIEECNIKKFRNESLHISTVDTVKIIQGGRVGISGARDRSLGVWSLTDGLNLVDQMNSAHNGWIWSLASTPKGDQFYSSSWDSSIKLWTLDQQLREVYCFKCKAAALSLACREGLVAAGQFTSNVAVFDPHCGGMPVMEYTCHNRSIMDICIIRDFIVAVSEDRTLSVWDITAGKIFKSGITVTKEGHPMTVSFSKGNLMFVGDTENRLHIFNTLNDSFELMESFDMGHQPRGSITSMWHNEGFVITGSKDTTIRIHTATRPPHLISQLTSAQGCVTSLDFADPALLAGCGNAVQLWLPC
ncbi:F-box/WD repeat-containing protein 9-like [Homalodisca vitripennis]|nr:F-box/WD repeat-containing protein 9-like [Homalodisca vitripennis]